MTGPHFEFSFDMSGHDRHARLQEAAQTLDVLTAPLSRGEDRSDGASPEAALLRELEGDVAEFAGFPLVHRITEGDFEAIGRAIPVPLSQLQDRFSFYWIGFPINLLPRLDWPFHRLECLVEFTTPDGAPHTLPRSFQILPDRKFQKLLEVGTALDLRLNENLEFEAAARIPAGVPVSADASAGGKLESGLSFAAGPFRYTFKRARLDHGPVGSEKVWWRLDDAELFQEDPPSLVVIAQVPRDVGEFGVRGALQAHRDFRLATAGLRSAVRNLGSWFRQFFDAGLPIQDTRTWDLTPSL